MTNAVKKIESNLPMVAPKSSFQASDIMLPRLYLQQSQSAQVNSNQAKAGDVIDSVTNEKVIDLKSPMNVLVLHFFKGWKTLVKGSGKFVRALEYKAGDAYPREEKIEGRLCENFETFNFYVLPTKDVKDGEQGFPALLSMKSTDLKVAKQLNSLLLQQEMRGKAWHDLTIELGTVQTKNDKGTFYNFQVKKGPAATTDQIEAAEFWEPWIKQGQVKVAEEEADEPQAPEDIAKAEY